MAVGSTTTRRCRGLSMERWFPRCPARAMAENRRSQWKLPSRAHCEASDPAPNSRDVPPAQAPLMANAAHELRALLDAAVDAVIVIDADGRIETFNRSAERLFGYAAAEVL